MMDTMPELWRHAALRMYTVGLTQGIAIGFCTGAIFVWAFK